MTYDTIFHWRSIDSIFIFAAVFSYVQYGFICTLYNTNQVACSTGCVIDGLDVLLTEEPHEGFVSFSSPINVSNLSYRSISQER